MKRQFPLGLFNTFSSFLGAVADFRLSRTFTARRTTFSIAGPRGPFSITDPRGL